MDKDVTEFWEIAKQLGPITGLILLAAYVIIVKLWAELKDVRRENREIYEARVADAVSYSQLTRESVSAMTQAAETNRAVVEHLGKMREK